MNSRISSQCLACSRYTPAEGTCDADPGGVPSDMLFFGEDHRKEQPGDGGIRFLQGQTPEQLEAFEDWQTTFG